MRKPLSIILTLAMVVTMVIGSATSVFAAESTAATTMKIAGTDGTVTITTDKGKDIAAKVDTKLLNGYTIKTAAASYCFISLDDSKAIKLGQNTKVKVEKSGKKIELNVKNGEIYFDVDKKLSGNESMNIKTGNMTTGIRGTSGTLKTIKQGQNTIDLFQLFSGKTEMKANTQQGVQNIIERILGVLGIGSQTQTVTPVNGGNANAQPLESTMASAGQQIAITGADSAASTGQQNVPTFERQALAVSEFGTRSILESAAIKGGMSAGEALAAGTEQIVEQVGDLTQTLENAGIAQAAVDKIAEAAADPQTLDAQIAGAEQQAVQQTQQAEQTIEGAKEEAAKVEGTTTNTTENKVLENVEVKTDSGANASGLTLSDDGTSTAAPSEQPKSSSGSGSGGQQEAWLTGYTGTYDGQGHAIATNLSARLADYDIWIFDNDESFNSFNTFYTRVKSEYAEVSKSMAETADGAPAFGDYLRGTWGTDLANYSENLASASNPHNVKNVADSGSFKYFALGKSAPFDEKQGAVTVKINPQELVVKWFLADIRSGIELGQAANITASSIGDISNNRPVPVAGLVDENGRFEQITCRATIGSDPTDIELAAIYTSDNPTAFGTTYNATVTGIDVVLYHHSDRPVETDELQASNYKLPASGLAISFSYHMPPQPVGSVVTDQDFFSAANRATWGDYTTYDLAFIAEGDGNESTYTKYAKVNGAGTQSVVTPGVEVSEVLAALGSDSNLYNTILWDTGRTAQYVSSEKLSANSTMTATASNRAIYISGAGIDCGFDTSGTLNMVSGGGLLVVKIGDSAGLTASDDGTRFKVPNLTVGANTFVKNYGTTTLMNSMTVSGDFNNYRNLITSEYSTGTIYLRGGDLTQESGVIWDKRKTVLDSDTTEPNPPYPMFNIMNGGNVNIYGGSLKHDLDVDWSYNFPADNIKTLVYATLGNHMTMKAMDNGKAFTYTAPDETQVKAYKFYYSTADGNNIAGSFIDGGVTTLSTATDTMMGNTTTHKNIWATELNTRYVAESYPDAAYAEITFPIAGSDASFTEYVAPTGLNVTDGVFADSNRANWSDYKKYDAAFVAERLNDFGIMEYRMYTLGGRDGGIVDFETVKSKLNGDEYSSIYWEPTIAGATELYVPLCEAQEMAHLNLDGNFGITATTTSKAVFISGPGIATAGYTTFSAVGSNKLFVRVGDGSAAAAGTSQTAIESANISVGSGVDIINSGRLDVRDLTLAASSKLANTGRLNCSSGGFAIDGSALFTNEGLGVINIDSYGPYVAMTGTGTLTNNGTMNLNAAFHINSGTTLLNRGHIEIPEQNTSAASSAMIRVVGGTFTQEVPSGKATEDVYVRDSRAVAYDATGALQGSSYGSMILLDNSGVVNLNGGRIEKSMNNAVSADNGQLRLTTITRAIFGNSINIYNYSYTPAGGSALPALKASQGDSCAINGTLLSGSDAATTSDYFYVTGSNSGGPVGTVGINYISFPAPAGTYEVATNPTGFTIVSGAGTAADGWLTGYSGTYDGDPHSPVSLSAVQQSDYWIWAFNDDDFNADNPNGVDYTPFLASMKAIFESGDFVATEESLAQVQSSIGGEQLPSVTSRTLTYNDWHLISNRETLVQEIGVVDVLSSGDYYYFALPKYPTGSAFTGTFTIDITRAAIGVEWFVVHPDLPNALNPEWDVEENGIPASSRATQGAVYPYNNDVDAPVVPYLVAGPASSELYSMPNVGWHELNGESFRGYELLTTNSAVNGAGTYSVTVTGIKCYDDQGNVIAEQMYVDNYYIDPATATYTYTLQPEGGGSNTGLVVTDGVFDSSNYANWSDSSKYDVRYVAVNGSSYMKYVNGAEMGTSVGIDEVLAAMSSTTYSSIYWDTGDLRRTVPDTYANDIEISAETANKAVLITGAGINFGTVTVTLSAEDGKKVYVRTESDSPDYSFGATTVAVDENAEFINSGSIKTQTLNVQHEGAMLTNIGAIEAKYVNVTSAGGLSNDAMFTLSEYGTGSVGAFNIQSGGATVTNSGILNIGGTPVTITDGAILTNMSGSNIISEGATVTIGAGSLLSNEGNINIEDGTNVGIAVAAGGTLEQYEFGIIWDKRAVDCSFNDYGAFQGVVSENRGLLSIEADAEVMLYGGELRRSIAEGTNFNEIVYEEDVYKIEAIVKTLLSRKDGNDIIDPVDIVDGNFSYTPADGAAPELAVLCKLNDGNIHGSVLLDDEPILNDDLGSDVYTGDTDLEDTFWATYNSTGFENGDMRYIYLSFPVPAGTFAD